MQNFAPSELANLHFEHFIIFSHSKAHDPIIIG